MKEFIFRKRLENWIRKHPVLFKWRYIRYYSVSTLKNGKAVLRLVVPKQPEGLHNENYVVPTDLIPRVISIIKRNNPGLKEITERPVL